jgi:hypothetical protein
MVGAAAETDGEGPAVYVVEVAADDPIPGEMLGMAVLFTVIRQASGDEVLAVPMAAISLGTDGRTFVTKQEPGTGGLLKVLCTPGVVGDVLVEVTPADHGSLESGDAVVIGG